MTYAEVCDVEAGFRALSKDEQERCSTLLSLHHYQGQQSYHPNGHC